MNLNDQDKKLLFKVVILLLICSGLIFLYFKGMNIWNAREESLRQTKEKIVKEYLIKVDSVNQKNIILFDSIKYLSLEIDSLKKIKVEIKKEDEKKINIIYDANAIDHAKWLNSTTSKLKDNKK